MTKIRINFLERNYTLPIEVKQEPWMRETRTHTYFCNGPFSQWYESSFETSLQKEGEVLTFNHVQQMLIAAKAKAYGDESAYRQIMVTYNKEEQKKIDTYLGYQNKEWDKRVKEISFHANWAKFSQNEELCATLMGTGKRTIVMGEEQEKIWGVGIDYNDDDILDEKNWNGINWLGKNLVEVRFWIQMVMDLQDVSPGVSFNPWERKIK